MRFISPVMVTFCWILDFSGKSFIIHAHDSQRCRERERERHLYSSVVTGTHYGTKTPPDQQPTKLCAGV
jgi:hypothetical protein